MSNELNETINQPIEDVTANPAADEGITPETESQEGTTESTETGEQPRKAELSAEEQVRVGKAIKAERERLKRDYAQQLELERTRIAQAQQQQHAPANSVYDPATGEYVDSTSAIGQILVRGQKIAQRQEQQKAQGEYEQLSTKASEGYERFDTYADSHKTFVNLGTDFMAEALKSTDDPAAVINYLGQHPEEIKRIAQLPPARQQREIVQADLKLNPPKKLVSNAKPPVNPINENNNPVARAEDQSFEQREAYYRRQNNME